MNTLDKIEVEITLPDYSKRKIPGLHICDGLALCREPDGLFFSLTHVNSGAMLCSFTISLTQDIRRNELTKLLNWFEKYGPKIPSILGDTLGSTDIQALQTNRKLKAFYKLMKQLKSRIQAIGTEMLIGSFYQDEASFQKNCAKFFKEELITYSGDAIMSPKVIAECILGNAKLV